MIEKFERAIKRFQYEGLHEEARREVFMLASSPLKLMCYFLFARGSSTNLKEFFPYSLFTHEIKDINSITKLKLAGR